MKGYDKGKEEIMKLYDSGVYLVNGTELVVDDAQAAAAIKSRTGREVTKAEAAQGTIAYGILKDHNVSGNMDKLQIKFDKLTSHDITFVGIIQTARASGLEKFPIPYVLTNCHNSLCAVRSMKMIICLVCPVRKNTAAFMFRPIRQSFTSLPERCWRQAAR